MQRIKPIRPATFTSTAPPEAVAVETQRRSLQTDYLLSAVAYLLLINLVAFALFAWDKHCAEHGMWRVPESTLLFMAAIGGSAGMIAGQRVMRHKSWKEPFRTHLHVIVAAQVVLIVVLCIPAVRNALLTLLGNYVG